MRPKIAFLLVIVVCALLPSFALPASDEIKPHGFWAGLNLFFAGKHLMIQCADRKQRDRDGACIGNVRKLYVEGQQYNSYKVNASTGAVLIKETDVNLAGDIHDYPPSFLQDCRVVDASNWECEKHLKEGGIDNGWYEGMKSGRAYRYATTNGMPDYYGSSISGFALLFYEVGLINLKEAALW